MMDGGGAPAVLCRARGKGIVMSRTAGISWLLVALALCAASAPILADDTESGVNGTQIVPVESKAIRMTFEQVDVYVTWPTPNSGEEKGVPEGHSTMLVTGLFMLTNESDQPQSITVAFPSDCGVSAFSRTVDGESVPVEKHGGQPFDNTSTINFAPREVHLVGVKYTGYSEECGGYGCIGNWSYILKTGAHWKGTLGKAVINVHFPEGMPPGGKGPFSFEAVKMTPDTWARVDDRTATWVFLDFKPSEDISLEWRGWGALLASNPFALKSRKEAAALLLEQGQVLSPSPKALPAFAAIREFFPESAAARRIDYEMVRVLSHHSVSGRSGDKLDYDAGIIDAGRAVKYFTAALKEPLEPRERQMALTELFILHSVEVPDPAKAAKVLEQLAKMKQMPDVQEALFKVGAVSPQEALDLLGSLTDQQLGGGDRESCATTSA